MRRYHILAIGLTSIIFEAKTTVKGFVIAVANPIPVDAMQHRKPVYESYPRRTHNEATIGSSVSIFSNSPRNDPSE